MKVVKIVLGAALVGGLALGMVAPNPGLAANTPANVLPSDNLTYGRMGMFMGQYFQGNMHEIIAGKLGMTTDELYKARLEGKSIADLLKEKDVKAADVVKAVVADREAALNKMVKEKTITKEQKDVMLENMKAMIEGMINADGVGPRGNGAGAGKGNYNNYGPCPMAPGGGQGMGRGRMGGMMGW